MSGCSAIRAAVVLTRRPSCISNCREEDERTDRHRAAATSIAHELNQPLGSIPTNTEAAEFMLSSRNSFDLYQGTIVLRADPPVG
jgi:hypothetical protein